MSRRWLQTGWGNSGAAWIGSSGSAGGTKPVGSWVRRLVIEDNNETLGWSAPTNVVRRLSSGAG